VSYNRNFLQGLVIVALFSALSVSIYHSTWNYPLVYDSHSKLVLGSSYTSLQNIPLSQRPLAWFSFYLDTLREVPNFRLTNSLILAALTSLVFLLFFILLRSFKKENSLFISVFLALLFLLHPLQVSVVTYVIQRMALLSCMFYLAALDIYLLIRLGKLKARGYILTLVFFVMALFTKENAAILPVVFLLVEFFIFPDDMFLKRNRKTIYCFLLVYFVAFILLCFANLPVNANFIWTEYKKSGIGIYEVLLTESRVLFFYLSLIFFPLPSRLTLLHVPVISSSFFQPLITLFSVPGVIGIIICCIVLRRKRPLFAFGVAFFMLNLLIESVVLPRHLIFEHRVILPMIGVLVAVSDLFSEASKGMRCCVLKDKKFLSVAVTALFVLLFLCWSTSCRNSVWKTRVTMWNDVVQKLPPESEHIDRYNFALAHYNLGSVYERAGKNEQAMKQYKKAISVKPDYEEPRYNMGNVLVKSGDIAGAVEMYKAAIAINPNSAQAHCNLGSALGEIGDMQGAVQQYKRALNIKSNYPEALYNMGNVFVKMGNIKEAMLYYNRALSLKPDSAEAHCNLANALVMSGNISGAIKHYKTALKITPDYFEANHNFANVLVKTGNIHEAVKYYKYAIVLNDGYAKVHCNLANALAMLGKTAEAVEHFRKAIFIKPDYAKAHYGLGSVLKISNPQEAIRHFKKVLEAEPNFAEAYNSLGNALRRVGKFSEAVQNFEQALIIKPGFVEVYINLGILFGMRGNLPQSLKYFNKALEINPNFEKAHYNIGYVLEVSGKHEEAIQHIKKALQIKQGYTKARNYLIELMRPK